MKQKEDLRILKTRASIYRGLIQLMKNKSFDSIKVSEICSAAMINRSTFYDHFNDKFELIQAIIINMGEELFVSNHKSFKPKNCKDYYYQLLLSLLEYISNHIDFYSGIIKSNYASIARDMIQKILIDHSVIILDQYHLNHSSIPTLKYVSFYISGFIQIIFDSISNDPNINIDVILKQLLLFIPNEKVQ